MRIVSFFLLFVVLVSLAAGMSAGPVVETAVKDDVVTIFFTGNELGTLKPCGCSGGQLGGLEKRPAIFGTAAKSQRMIVDTGRIVAGDSEQNLIKFGIIIQAYNILKYDVVNLARKDLRIAKDQGILSDPVLNFISAYSEGEGEKVSSRAKKKFSLSGRDVTVNIISADVKSPEELPKKLSLDKELESINILIAQGCNEQTIDAISRIAAVDCVICPPQSDTPMLISESDNKPLFVSVGRYGKYVAKLEIRYERAVNKYEFAFSSVPVTEALDEDESLVELYRTYQLLVKEAGLLSRQPRFVLNNGLEYAGSETCRMCHKYEYTKWSKSPHADAFSTLEKVGSDFDPECVGCHVVGLEYQSGFVSTDKTAHLKDVGCENCHGPGSKHVETFGEVLTGEPRLDCTYCHTPEHSANYSGNEGVYFEKIIHWKEQKTVGDVKK